MEPVEGDAATHDPRLPGQPEGARPGVERAETGVAGVSGLYENLRPERYHSRQMVEHRP